MTQTPQPPPGNVPPVTPGVPGYGRPPRYEPGMCAGFEAGAVFGLGWRTLWSAWPQIAGAVLLAWVVQLVVSFVPFVGGIASLFVAPLMAAAQFQAVKVIRGDRTEVGEIFRIFGPNYWPIFLVVLLTNLSMIVAVIPGVIGVVLFAVGVNAGGFGGTLATGAGVVMLVLGMLVGLYVYGRLMFSVFLMFDAPPGSLEFIDAMKLSWARSTPFAWSILGLLILSSLALVASVLLLGVGLLLVGVPLQAALMAAAYHTLLPRTGGRACTRCGYDLSHLPLGPCPECGTYQGVA